MSVIKLLLLAVSFLGYGLFLHYRCRIKGVLLPATIFAGVIVTLYLCSLLNMLETAAWFVYMGGFAAGGYLLIFKRPTAFVWRIPFGLLFCVALCGYFVIFLCSARLYAHDDFSHWGLIVKEMSLLDRLPNFSSETIGFPAYPPATALFAYYVTKFIGFGENKMLMAQMFLTIGFGCSIFGFTIPGKKGILTQLFASLSVLLMLALFQQGTSTMLVDTVLPIAAVANTVVIIHYRSELEKAAVLSLLLSTVTILIKNSGLLFALVNMGLLLYPLLQARKHKSLKKSAVIAVLSAVAIPIFMLILWHGHANLVFPQDAVMGHHAMSIENYKANLLSKPISQISEITAQFIKNALNPATRSNRVMVTICGAALAAVMLAHFGFKQQLKGVRPALIAMLSFYIVYLAGIYGMYLFSMPPEEASSFVSFSRYAITAVIYLVGIFSIGVLHDIERIEVPPVRLGVIITMISVIIYCFAFTKSYDVFYKRPLYEYTRVYRYDRAFVDTPINSGDSYLLYMPSSAADGSFAKYLTRYKLHTTDFKIITQIDENFEQELKVYDHFVVVETDEQIQWFLKSRQPRQTIE